MKPLDPTSQPSLWLQRSPGPVRPAAQGGATADVLVLGGGMTGVACAHALAGAGLSVLLLEAGTIGCAATARNVGFILEGVAESYVRTVALWGQATAQRVRRFTVQNHAAIEALVASEGIACGHARRGSLHLAGTPVEADELAQGTEALVRDGFAAEFVPRETLPAWAQPSYLCGQIIPGDGELDPVAFALGIAAAAERRGAVLHEHSEVVALRSDGDGVSATLRGGGTVSASAVVVATNAYAGRLVPWLTSRIDPTRGQVLATGPVAERVFPQPIYASHGFEYWRQLDSGEIIMGGWRNLDIDAEVGDDHALHGAIQQKMEAFLRGLHPAIATVPIVARWSGIMGFSRDSLPIVGPLPGSPTTYLCAGFTGHGFGFAVRAAELLRDLILSGSHPEADLFDPRRLA